ncbi:peptidylprolyl isomerase [Zhouia sp. PK063]|uniref:peptidylprolyl isomerase n=1 Tax=Zhouia sp. PK063 TaxID=3373602 RepID=UPI0037A14707
MKHLKLIAIAAVLLLTGCKSAKYRALGDGLFADIQTSKGDIIVKLAYDKAPVTVANFITLAEGTNPYVTDSLKGKKFYDGTIFHRVIKGFMIQGGDPTGTGAGGPGYKFDNEINDSLSHNKAGIISMANAGPNTNGSQFFITHKPQPTLDGGYSVFGETVDGLDVVDTIATTKTDPRDKPLQDVTINTIKIVRNGKEAKAFDAVKVMTSYFDKKNAEVEALNKVKKDMANEFAAQRDSAQTTPSGLKYIFLKKAENGEKPKTGDYVMVNYAGYFSDGGMFDTNIEDIANKFKTQTRQDPSLYTPVPMQYSPDAGLIQGFKEGLQLMTVGDKVRLFIPSELAYGVAGRGPIPSNADLVFDLEITDIQK